MDKLIDLLLKLIPDYINSLVSLISGPKRFIATLNISSPKMLQQSLAFYAVTMLIMLLVQIPIIPLKDGQFFQAILPIAIVTLLAFFTSVLLLWLCWKLVGGELDYKGFVIVSSYVMSVSSYIFLVFYYIALGVIKGFAPELFAQLHTAEADYYEAMHDPVYKVYVVIIGVGILAACSWVFLAWGGYRQLNKVSKLRSGVACLIYLIVSICLTIIFGLMGMVTSPLPSPRADLPKDLLGEWILQTKSSVYLVNQPDIDKYNFGQTGTSGGYTHCQFKTTQTDGCLIYHSTCSYGHARVTESTLELTPAQKTLLMEKNACTQQKTEKTLLPVKLSYKYRILREPTGLRLCLEGAYGEQCLLANNALPNSE